MKKWLSRALYFLLWLLTVCAGAAELAAVGLWWEMRRYLEEFGAAENPYVEEDAFVVGLFSVALLVFFLLLLVLALFWRGQRKKTGEMRR